MLTQLKGWVCRTFKDSVSEGSCLRKLLEQLEVRSYPPQKDALKGLLKPLKELWERQVSQTLGCESMYRCPQLCRLLWCVLCDVSPAASGEIRPSDTGRETQKELDTGHSGRGAQQSHATEDREPREPPRPTAAPAAEEELQPLREFLIHLLELILVITIMNRTRRPSTI